MEKVLGFGGLFFRSKNPKMLARWYDHSGVDEAPPDYGFAYWTQQLDPTVFQPFAQDTDYFGDSRYSFMLNFRVANLEAMVAQLRAAGIAVEVDPNRVSELHFRAVERSGRESGSDIANRKGMNTRCPNFQVPKQLDSAYSIIGLEARPLPKRW
jgi:glyoxylase I family protein